MSSIFSPKTPAVPPPPPPPARSSEEVGAAAEAERKRQALASGRASTVLAGELTDEPETATKTLLGA